MGACCRNGTGNPGEREPAAAAGWGSLCDRRSFWRHGGLTVLLVCLAFSAFVRIRQPLNDPGFLTDSPAGIMKSDPGLLFYFLERIVQSGGAIPPDFRAEPRVEYPSRIDVFMLDTVSQEFPIAWAWLALRPAVPLHVFAMIAMALFTSLVVVGVYLLARELTQSRAGAAAAAVFYVLLPANYRTIGLVLLREDFSLPFFAAHLYLLARAFRLRTTGAALWCAAPLVLALASWHAMSFVVGLEMVCVLLWFLRTGENPLAAPRAWMAPAAVAAASLGIPALRSTGFILALPMQIAIGLLAAAALCSRARAGRAAQAACALGVIALAAVARAWVFRASGDDYGHVWHLLAAKLTHLGRMPDDPSLVPFDARMMWQGPFKTTGWRKFHQFFGGSLLALLAVAVPGARNWWRGLGRRADNLLLAFTALALANTWLVDRVMVVAGLLLPVTVVAILWRLAWRPVHALLVAILLSWQVLVFVGHFSHLRNVWYQPAYQTQEYRALLRALPSLVPPGEAIAADPVVSTAILSTTGNPILLQPKWERSASRVPFRDYVQTFYQGTPDDLRRLLLNKYRCRYVLFDCSFLDNARWIGGIPLSATEPIAGTVAAHILNRDPAVFSNIPGYQLLYRSPPALVANAGFPLGLMRLYRLTE